MFFFSFLWVGVGVLAPSFVMTRFLDKHPPLGCSSLHWCNTHQLLNLALTRACYCIEGSQGRHLLNSTSEFSIHRKQSGQRTWMLYTNLQIFHIPFLFFPTCLQWWQWQALASWPVIKQTPASQSPIMIAPSCLDFPHIHGSIWTHDTRQPTNDTRHKTVKTLQVSLWL